MAKKKSTKLNKAPITTPEMRGLICLSLAIVTFISLLSFSQGHETHNLLGMMGLSIAFLLHALFGISSYALCLFLAWIGWRQLFNKPINHFFLKSLYVSVFVLSSGFLLSVLETEKPLFTIDLLHFFYPFLKDSRIHYHLGGAPFFYLYRDLPYLNLEHLLNWLGVTCLFLTTWIASLLFLTKISPLKIFYALKEKLPERITVPSFPAFPSKKVEVSLPQESETLRYVKLRMPRQEVVEKIIEEEPPKIKPIKHKPIELPSSSSDYAIPSFSLLTNAKKVDQTHLKQNLKDQAKVLEETLMSFGIEAKVGQINCGPTITSFEVHPAIGVKVQKIKTLENDIALNMEAKSIRIIAPIPGKAAVGIEVPNAIPQEVGFKDMLQAYQQSGQKLRIPILLGKAVNGDYVMSDLTKWPHCIIAGATGSGKSVCINTIIMSILLNSRPDEIKLLMVDPKKVELTAYSKLPHMLAPVITEPRDACSALNWLVREMEKRYEILKQIGVRNIDAFNTRKINQELESSLEIEIPEKLPYYVGIIDELADLMMVSSSDIETPIARIAQMARAVGIHLILATQRPSREVITGLIKANFPTRISFKVASRINSQIVLDETGAESLLGNGDMLFLPPGSSHLIRAQAAYIRDEDITAIIEAITKQAPPNYVIQSFKQGEFPDSGFDDNGADNDEPEDPLYPQALDIILSTGNASTTFLQRKLKIGYARAASLIDALEARGILGPAEGAKPRKILAPLKRAQKEESPDLLDRLEEE